MGSMRETLKNILVAALALFLLHGTIGYHVQRREIRNVGLLRARHADEVATLKAKLEEKAKELAALGAEEALLRERLNTLIDESRDIPDLSFLDTLAKGKLAGLNVLDDDPFLASAYRGRPVIIEDLVADDFYTRPGVEATTLKFRGEGRVARATFPYHRPENAVLRKLDRKALHRVSFIGKIKDWAGRFDIDDARLLGYAPEPR